MKQTLILMMIAMLAATPAFAASPKAAAAAKMAYVVIAASQVQDTEFLETVKALKAAGVQVVVAAPELKAADGMLGGSFTPDITIDAIDSAKADLIAVIGGNGSFALWENAALIAKVKEFDAKGKYVAAICAASGVLANAGVLAGKDATCYPYDPIIQLLKSKGATYLTDTVVTAGKTITGNGPDASVPFGKKLASVLN